MPVKRALKLDSHAVEKVPDTSQEISKNNRHPFSPTTGTCLLSPFSSPRSSNIQQHRNGLSNGKKDKVESLVVKSSGKGQQETGERDKLLVLQSEVEDSLETFVHIRQNLTSLQALEGTRGLEKILGVSDSSGNLKSEVRKTRKLLEQAGKQKLLKRSNAKHPIQEYLHPLDSFEFLRTIAN